MSSILRCVQISFCAVVLCMQLSVYAQAQSLLSRTVSLQVTSVRLEKVLELLAQKGQFRFSYNSNIVPRDSLVTLRATNQTVKEILDYLLRTRFEYRESGTYLILRYAPLKLSLITEKTNADENAYFISGFVVDDSNGKKLDNASVYDKRLLQATLTNSNGYFELRLKNRDQPIEISVSKENYRDTTYTILADVTIKYEKKKGVLGYLRGDQKLENLGLGRLFLSSKQRIQSLNIGGLIAQSPFQASLSPGLGSHGMFSGQVVNKVSLNILGGYNAGVDGVELGGLFNMDRGNVRPVQVAGIFNLVGGSVEGVQLAGLMNNVLVNAKAVQAAGLYNHVADSLKGVQLAGLSNYAGKNMQGVQAAGLGNIAMHKMDGVQMAGLFNYASDMKGVQITGLVNYAKNMRGLQIGLINVADTSSGYAIGLLNLVKNGYHKLTLSANEVNKINVSFKSGNGKLYTIWTAGFNTNSTNKAYSYGLGFGNELKFTNWLSLNPEISTRNVYQGSWDYVNLLNRFDAGFTIRLNKFISVYGGPALNIYYSDQAGQIAGYSYVKNNSRFHFSHPNWSGWIGWTAGVALF